jgi:hypothetical protein
VEVVGPELCDVVGPELCDVVGPELCDVVATPEAPDEAEAEAEAEASALLTCLIDLRPLIQLFACALPILPTLTPKCGDS